MQNDVLVSVKELSRFYGTQCAVNHISFQVKRGEVLGFLGPNGAGKSTTMYMLTGNLAPTEGEIIINGIDMLEHPKAAKSHIGFLPEQPPLYRELSVDEYLRFCAKLNRVNANKLADALDTAKQRCGLIDVGNRLIGNLSKGYQQRVGIAQAIIHSPPVVILDEPTVGLDPIQIREIRQLIRDLGGEHSVILSSHILPEIQATCDRVQIINQGELVLSDSVEELEQHMHESSLIVVLKNPPAITELENIHDVRAVQQVDDNQFKIHFDPGHNPAESIAEAAAQKQWRLIELTPEKRSLEQVFVDITTSEASESTSEDTDGDQAA